MYIKQIVIQGFKSYKDQTALEPFSPGHNVVVGRNGSGKSNFFWAVRFALSDAYSNMTREERQSLLHEGTGPATLSAFVEVIFDNSDQRFPTGKDEVVLRRTIGLKKDEYSLDKKSITKTEVLSLFETAGFSRSNPYYIVPQGRITALTNAKDAERLQLLKEVAGTRVYEQRRQESLKIMEETDHKRSKIDELLDVIEERLEELESEKEELKQFQDLDRERRCLEYTIYTREQNELNETLAELEEARRNEVEDSNHRQSQLSERDQNIAAIEQKIRETKAQVAGLTAERAQCDDDREEYIKAKAQLELIIEDLQDTVTSNEASKESVLRELEALQEKIDEKQREVETIRPQFDEALRKETELKQRFDSGDLERTALYSKQGRTKQFATKAARDEYLSAEIQRLETAVAKNEQQASEIDGQLAAHREQIAEMNHNVEEVQARAEERRAEARSLQEREADFRRQRNALDEERKELWREENRSSVAAQTAKEEADRSERSLYGMMDKVTADGLRAVQRIVARENIQGVYGPLYDLFEVDKPFQTAVEVIAGGSLWHVVVDKDDTASEILRHLNRERSGRVTFMPLNRLHPKKPTYPQSNDAVVMIQKLRFEERYRPAFEQVFGKALICASLEVASGYARNQGLNCVTLQGDRAERKGALTGGFRDSRTSKLELISKLKELRATQTEQEASAESLHTRISRVDQEITQCRSRMAEVEQQRRALAAELATAGEVERIEKEKAVLEALVTRKEASRAALAATVQNLKTQIAAYTAELNSGMFSRTLSDEELARLQELTAELGEIEEELKAATDERAKLESRKKIAEFQLSQNLLRKKTDLSVQLENLSTVSPDSQVNVVGDRQAELDGLTANITRSVERIAEIDEQLEALQNELREAAEELDSARTEHQHANKALETHRQALAKYVSKKTSLLKRKEDCVRSIRELGVLPDDAWERFENVESNKLLKKLHGVNEKLKGYSHVNKKAFEQYLNFTKQRDSLEKRKAELDTSAAAIQDLISNLDQRKDEAIERTFTQVAGFFKEVWSSLVPGGTANLIMLRRADGSSATQDEVLSDDEDSQAPAAGAGARSIIDQYTGVSIALTFDSHSNDSASSTAAPLRMPQLSGGQKSLVALALIFAIQRCDPAPFYLFDEIDAALDAQYRAAVASMIHSLATTAQFITTTFRSELLVHADKFYGVTFVNKVSKVQAITREDAQAFVDEAANVAVVGTAGDAGGNGDDAIGGMVGMSAGALHSCCGRPVQQPSDNNPNDPQVIKERAAAAAAAAPSQEPQSDEKIQRDFDRARSLALSGKRPKNRKSSPVRSGNQQSSRAFCSYCNKGLAKRIETKNQAAAAIKEFDRDDKDEEDYDEQYD
ncbi:Structural maintenance of chromosomes protein 3 [Geranomyces variabilis]|nr:Structural maintenance of chromosomes protein 3 [Geranomyces variabilis]